MMAYQVVEYAAQTQVAIVKRSGVKLIDFETF